MSITDIEFRLPIDNTFTNLLLCEGLLYLLNNSQPNVLHGQFRLYLDDIKWSFKNLDDGRIEQISLGFSGNDIKPSKKRPSALHRLLQMLNIPLPTNRIGNYGTLLKIIKENIDNVSLSGRPMKIDLFMDNRSKNKGVYIGGIRHKEEGISFQLFKTERYTGITSLEFGTPSEQLTTYLSREAVLISLLGIYSSFVTRVFENEKNYYFFLFFSSEEGLKMLSSYNKGECEVLFRLKDRTRELLREVIRQSFAEELIMTEILINVGVQEMFSKVEPAKQLSMVLVKMAQEGQTYKIYGLIPFTIYLRKEIELFRVFSKLLSPRGIVLERLRQRENVEYNNLLSAIMGVYRFVTLNDRQGLFIMLRELHNAYQKVRTDDRLRRQARMYEQLLRELSYVTGLL